MSIGVIQITSLLEGLLDSFEPTDNVIRQPITKPGDLPKPIFQWVGGKREMLPQYEQFLPKSFGNYWEPFVGGAALFFKLRPKNAHLNDSNPELMVAYSAIRDNYSQVVALLSRLRQRHSVELYTAVRALDREINILKVLPGYEIAARMIYLNQTCFNAVYRVNKLGQFNVPIGSSLNRVICDPLALEKASSALGAAKLTSLDFEESLNGASKGDFVYFDPPYDPISKYSDFTRYTKEKFYKFDQFRLRKTFGELASRGCKVMLSNSNSDFIRDIYRDFYIHEVKSTRTLNSKTDGRGKITELLITSYRCDS